jgi:uncharacterized protein (DUF1501 family)
MRRRDFLATSALGAALLPVRRAFAEDTVPAAGRKFLFVVNYGGWDPTRVLAPEFDNPNVDMERDAGTAAAGGILYTDHAERPSVAQFMQTWHERMLILKGVLVPSVAHENCLRLCMTGSTRQDASDWPAVMGGVAGADFALPHVVAAGPSYPGEFGAFVTRTGTSGQLPALLDGSILGWSDSPVRAPHPRAEEIMDRHLERRIAAWNLTTRAGRDAGLGGAYATALERAQVLKGLRDLVNWSGSSGFAEQIDFAVDALSLGVSRCVTLSYYLNSWDTHVYNDLYQSLNFEGLYAGLGSLMEKLARLPGENGGTLADETVVVVLSEMGRTPKLNAGQGKDHWPYTSMMLVGPGLAGDRVIGGYDTLYYGQPVDLQSGDVDESGDALSHDTVGATLLALAGVDSEEFLPGVARLDGALSE